MSIVIQDVIEKLIEPIGHLQQTVDTLQFGDPKTEVTGIVTTFMATQRVLEEAVTTGSNLIIAHEGPFFSHSDSFEKVIENDPVYQTKKKFILDSGLAIFRFHDYLHRYTPDGVMEGLLHALAWDTYVTDHQPFASIVEMPVMTVRQVVKYVKSKLGLAFVRVAGDVDAQCKRVGLLVGYRGGGRLAIPLFQQAHLDLIIYGEGPEWETPEYVRDASWQGRAKALIVYGHAESEEWGMNLLAKRLQRQFPDIPVRFIRDKPVFVCL